MLTTEAGLVISPTDLVDLLECEHRSTLNHALAARIPGVPESDSTGATLITKHGLAHEQAALARLRERFGGGLVEIGIPAPRHDALAEAAEETRAALESGAPAVYQAVFYDDGFYGRADFVIASPEGYEPHDTKLARHATPAAVLQLTAYADALRRAGHPTGPSMHLLLGDDNTHTFAVADFLPLVDHLRTRLRTRLAVPAALPARLWADERPACATCKFARSCSTGREAARDLSLVAGMRTDQRRKLTAAGLATIDALANATANDRPADMSAATFGSLRSQAALQVIQDNSRTLDDPTGKVAYEVLSPDVLSTLPDPSPGDVFFDMEGDPFALAGEGLEYLFGAITHGDVFTPFWAHSRSQEKAAFEGFVDFALERMLAHPGSHVYHYAPYEVSALKRLAALHGTREEAVDTLLRTGALVDLYAVVRKALRISQRSYSIKYLEPLYMPEARSGEVKNAVSSIEAYEEYLTLLELGDTEQAAAVLDGIKEYNTYDCVSTHRLYRFLLDARAEAGIEPHVPDQSAMDTLINDTAEELAAERRAERAAKLAAVVDPLMEGLPDNPADATEDEKARALLAAAVGYHRRETNPAWWDFFRQVGAPLPDLEVDNTCAVPVSVRTDDWVMPSGRVRNAKREVHAVCDPDRPHPFGHGEQVRLLYPGNPNSWTRKAEVVSESAGGVVLLESVKPDELDSLRPIAILPGDPVKPAPKDDAVYELAQSVVDVLPVLPPHPGIDLLRRIPPRLVSGTLPQGEDLVAAVIRAVDLLDGSTLAVQGPPGAGKTYLAGRLIAHLIKRGKSVAVTSTSHKAVENVLSAAKAAGRELGVPIPCAKKAKGKPAKDCEWEQPRDNPAMVRWRNEQGGGHLVGGTAWTFSNSAMREQPFDVLIIDEAGQFALADALAVSTCTRNLVLLGDPQQLPQVVQGTHPAGADASALGHLLGDADVIPPALGYFMDQSRRMHPNVCDPVSRLSYAGRLHAHPTAADRSVAEVESGLYLNLVDHSHNITSSPEEASEVVAVVRSLMGRTWTDQGTSRPLVEEDVLVVAPYNLQVRVVRRALEQAGYDEVRVGTVDKFQGQEAPVVVATMTSSAAVDLPRGLDFLLSRNRLNVALSRAQAVAVLVCSPRLVEADIRGVEQMRLVSGMIGLMNGARRWTLS
ncbi:TM0106 family RecB-like putative nuclease [Umezawaea sp. Da 62-37]|uniref:TM0106 family RecB-like putative nuclease n=1 Tax=Umezawaea sp. Da 62-37 TaxID=3075927 RepID=UPI0028F71C30|nr:TM0106 family RecB-like putative nuclease [Umezawaea sp. Da 62-37]WNV84121.1 TM0106 family RecB-like putative nuclease [Umezawaea sp. Da 62-37]